MVFPGLATIRVFGTRVLGRWHDASVSSGLLEVIARCYIVEAVLVYIFDLLRQTHDHLTNGAGRPLGDDFVNYWSGAFLALHQRALEVYSPIAFHSFEQSVVGEHLQGYHYSYPPTLLVLTAPLALIPYVPALALWVCGSWFAFYRALRLAMPNGHALLLALAAPAVFINAVAGQNGTWTAALLGGGLGLLDCRPILAGGLFGLMIYKPHLGILLPVALLAGRRWRALTATAVTAGAVIVASLICFGPEVWRDFLREIAILRQVILEDGTGVWHRMVSVFVTARRLGADVTTAYVIQALAAGLAGIAVAVVWFRGASLGVRNAVLVLGTCLATPYLQDYDLVIGALVVAWLAHEPNLSHTLERPLYIASALVLLLPLFAAPIATLTWLAVGPFFLLPAFLIAVQLGFGERRAMQMN